MPETAATDNETLDHLLWVVADGPTLQGIRAMSKQDVGRDGEHRGMVSGATQFPI